MWRLVSIVAIALLITLGGFLALYYFRGTGETGSGITTQKGTSQVLMSLGQTPRLLGPGINMNHTLTLFPGTDAVGNATLSAEQPRGLTVSFKPSSVTLSGNDVAVDVSVHAANPVNPGDYKVGIKVEWPSGSSNLTFHFTVVHHLVLLLGGSAAAGVFSPLNLKAHLGETITWLSLDAGSDEYGGLRSVRVVELNAASPTLSLFSTWSYAFMRAGTYHIEDPLNAIQVVGGTIVVE